MMGSVSVIEFAGGKKLRSDSKGNTYKNKNVSKIANNAKICAGFLILKSMELGN